MLTFSVEENPENLEKTHEFRQRVDELFPRVIKRLGVFYLRPVFELLFSTPKETDNT